MAGGSPRVRFGYLGPLEVEVAARRVPVSGARRRALLLRLLIAANNVVPAERLIEDLWGDNLPESPSNALQAYISRLRLVIEAEQAGRREPSLLLTRAPGYVLTVDPGMIDADRFASLTTEARSALHRGRPDEAVTMLAKASDLWRGPALVEVADQPWAAAEVARLEELRWSAVEDRLEADLVMGRHAEVASEAEAALAHRPLRERLWAHRILALYRSGRQADALRSYGELRRILGEELGIQPSATLARLEEAVLLQKADLDWRPPELPSLGSVPAIDACDQGTDEPGHHVITVPNSASSFVGRKAELSELADCCRTARVLTLIGAGGVGKTRLAATLARSVSHHYPDGVVWVELAPVRDPTLVSAAVAASIGLRGPTGAAPIHAVVHHVRGRQMLIVLDNCEHLVEACSELVHALVEASPEVRVLSTSREPLRVAGETTYRVPSLAEGDAHQLFKERATAAGWRSDTEEATTGAVLAVCRRLDCIPLAVELAAARTPVLSPAEIAAGLDARLPVLGAGPRTAPPRHQTLQSTLDWSYDTLGPAERSLLCRSSVFAGGFAMAAVEEVCPGGAVEPLHVLDVLAALVDKSMVVVVPQQPTRPSRYRMLETVRDDAMNRLLATGEAGAIRDRHLRWAVRLAEEAEPHLTGRGAASRLARLDQERDNLREALTWSMSSQPVLGLRLAAALLFFWDRRDQREGLRWLRELLDLAGEADQFLLAKTLNAVGLLADRQAAVHLARPAYQRALELNQSVGDPIGTATSLRGLGNLAFIGGDTQTARAHYEECLRIGGTVGDRLTTIAPLINLGYLANVRGEFAEARRLLEEAVRRCHEAGDESMGAWALFHLAQVAATLGDYEEARQHLANSLELSSRLENRQQHAAATTALGYVALLEGDYETAQRLHAQAMHVQHEIGDEIMMAWATCDVAELLRAQGSLDDARRTLQGCVADAHRLEERYLELWARVRLARVLRCQHDYDSAADVLSEALDDALQLGNGLAVAETVGELALLAAKTGNARGAAVHFGHADRLRSEMAAPVPPYLRNDHELTAEAVRQALGDLEFSLAYAEGDHRR